MDSKPLLIVKRGGDSYLAALVALDGGSYDREKIGSTPQDAAAYVRRETDRFKGELDLFIPDDVSLLLDGPPGNT